MGVHVTSMPKEQVKKEVEEEKKCNIGESATILRNNWLREKGRKIRTIAVFASAMLATRPEVAFYTTLFYV